MIMLCEDCGCFLFTVIIIVQHFSRLGGFEPPVALDWLRDGEKRDGCVWFVLFYVRSSALFWQRNVTLKRKHAPRLRPHLFIVSQVLF